MPLTSTQNRLLQTVRRAVQAGRPLEDGTIAAEGPHLLAEALGSPWLVEHIFCSTESMERHDALLADASRRGIQVTEVALRAFRAMSDTEQNQGILSLLRPASCDWSQLFKAPGPLVIMDGIQDPGNAGAIVRSAEAFGCAGVALTVGCVRVSNGKFLRAAAGSAFRLPLLENLRRPEIISRIHEAKRPLFALAVDGSKQLFTTCLPANFALVVGSEGAGVSPLLQNASVTLAIPTRGVESLNAAIACSVALFEAARQRESTSV